MNKKALLASTILELEKQKNNLTASVETTHQIAVEAPGAMQSHSDTTKAQTHILADNLRNLLAEKERAIAVLKKNAGYPIKTM